MKAQPQEIISGENVTELLRNLIRSRQLCKIRIPNTHYCWITLLSGMQEEGPSSFLLIDGLPAIERALSAAKENEVAVEYQEQGGVLCHFQCKVARNLPQVIWVERPEVIYRVQRRIYFRLKAQGGTEITFRLDSGEEKKARVRDYSLGGIAILTANRLAVKPDDQLKDLELKIPEEGEWLAFSIPLAVVRRTDRLENAFLYGLEFLQLPDPVRKKLARHIFEKQRLLLRKFGKNPSLPNPF